MESNQARRFLLLHGKQVVGYIRPGRKTDLPDEEKALLEACEGDLTQFALALGPDYQLLEVSLEESDYPLLFTAESLNDRRKYYLFHNGAIVGVLTASFHHGEFSALLDEERAVAELPEPLADFWRRNHGDLNAFLQGMEEEERRFNYLEALEDETPQEIMAELEADKTEITRHWERGLALRDRFLFLRALRELEVAAALCDKYAMVDFLAELCNEMGNLYIAFEDYESATEVFEEGLSYRPADLVSRVRLLTNLSQAYDLAENRKKAIERVEEALAIIPPDIYDSLLAGVYSQAASLYNQEGNFDKAIQFYKLASYLANHSESVSEQERAMFHNNLGMAYLEHGDSPQALEQLKAAVALQPQDPFYQENLTRCYDQLG